MTKREMLMWISALKTLFDDIDSSLECANLTGANLTGANLYDANGYAEFYFAGMSSRGDCVRVIACESGIEIYAGCFQKKTLAEFIEQANRTKEADSLYHRIAIPALTEYEKWVKEQS